MASEKYFPIFLNLHNKKILVIGGGKIASHKLERLSDCRGDFTVVAPEISESIVQLKEKLDIKLVKRAFESDDLTDQDLVIAAVDNLALQKEVYELCEERRILCNAVDSPEYCSFIFPAIIKRNDLIVAVSTSGRAPAAAGAIRRYIENALPDDLEEKLEQIYNYRSSLPAGSQRMKQVTEFARKLFLES